MNGSGQREGLFIALAAQKIGDPQRLAAELRRVMKIVDRKLCGAAIRSEDGRPEIGGSRRLDENILRLLAE